MSHNSYDVSKIFEESPDSRNELPTDVKVQVINEKKVPDVSVFSDICDSDILFFPIQNKNPLCTGPPQQEILLPPTTSNICILPSVTSKKQCYDEVQCYCLKSHALPKSNYCSSICNSSSTLKCQGYFDTGSSFQNDAKSTKQLADKASFTNLSTNLLEKKEYSTFSDDILKHFRQQDKKLDDLQNQISLFLQQKNSSCQAHNLLEYDKESISNGKALNTECSKKVSAQNCPKAGELDQNYILMYIKEHSDQISKLQDQIDLLLKRTEKLESLYSVNEKVVCGKEEMLSSSSPQVSPNDGISSIPVDLSCQSDQNEIVCHKEKQVKKTSTSTMTSLTFEGNDKFVFRKMLTVVTDVSNCQKDVSIQCPQGIDTTAAETRTKVVGIESNSPQNEKQITPKSIDSRKKKQKSLKSPKNSGNRNRKSNQEQVLEKVPGILSPTNAYSSNVFTQYRTVHPDCAGQSSDSDRENKLANDILSPKEKILFENISRNIDQLVGTQDNEDLYSHSKNANDFPICASKHQKDCKTKNTPRPILSSTDRNKNCLKSSSRRSSSTSSNTSTDTVYVSPSQGDKADFHTTYSNRDSSAVSKYGMSSPNLSLATKMYLENYGLVHQSDYSSPQDKTERTFTRKHRTSDCRRQLR